MKVAILGSTGMLGSMVYRYLSQQPVYDLTTYSRDILSTDTITVTDLTRLLSGRDYAINCIGLIKPRINEYAASSVRDAIQVNSLFPHALAHAAEQTGCKVIQIATDCVYSGFDGPYDELDPHDALDVYGKTKSLGEVQSSWVANLRCSIIGPELTDPPRPACSLLNWFTSQPQGAIVSGYRNHRWNGLTTLTFARLCHGLMSTDWDTIIRPARHVVPADVVTKAELLDHFRHAYRRTDIRIEEVDALAAVDRTLSTLDEDGNRKLWQAAGYETPPTIQQMIEGLIAYQ